MKGYNDLIRKKNAILAKKKWYAFYFEARIEGIPAQNTSAEFTLNK